MQELDRKPEEPEYDETQPLYEDDSICKTCDGSGEHHGHLCKTCGGTGYTSS